MLLVWFTLIMLAMVFLLHIIGQTIPHQMLKKKKINPYECGFDPMNSSRLPFSFRFFLIALLFLMFDLEIALLMPLPLSLLLTPTYKSLINLFMFMIMLSVGLYYEWVKGGLEWANKL